MSDLTRLKQELAAAASPAKAAVLQRFFKTGPGQYGEGDIFLGITVPVQRRIAAGYQLELPDIARLLADEIHEHRLCALFILEARFRKAGPDEQGAIARFYLEQAERVNNWDLVDLSADKILGRYLLNRDRAVLYELAASENLWRRRIAVIATFAFIKNGEWRDTFALAELLLDDRRDLIHKAVGWMLREVGKRVSEEKLEEFLKINHRRMPRTMLRYAIERLNEQKRKFYLGKSN